MRTSSRALAALALLACSQLATATGAAQEPVALLPASGANVDPGTLSAAHEVFRSYVEQAGAYTIRLVRGGAVAAVEPSPSEAVASAADAGTGLAAVLRLAMLGSNLHVRLTVYAAPDGRTIWFDSLQAGTPGDLDPVLKRLATGWARGTKATAAAEIDTVTDREARALNKRQATMQRGLRFGMMKAMSTADGEEPDAKGAGVYWLYDARSFLVDVSTDFYGGRGLHNFAFGFGGYAPLTRSEFSPYLGGGLRMAWTDVSHDWASGFQPYLAGGFLLGRLSSVGFRAEVAWFWDVYENAGTRANHLVGTLGVQF